MRAQTLKTVLGSILVTFVVLEILAHVYLFQFASKENFRKFATLAQLEQTDWNQQFLFTYHRYLGYTLTPNYVDGKNRHNALGFRGEDFPLKKPAGEYRIICIGGSTTYTSFIDDYHFSYPYLLEQELHQRGFDRVRVINAGVGGWASWESFIDLQFRLLDLDPDLVIIYQNLNDITARLVWPHDAYKGDNSGRLQPQFSKIFMPGILEYSTLFRIVMIQTGLTTPHTSLERAVSKHNREHYVGDEFLDQKQQNTYPQGIFVEAPALDMLKTNTPVYFERNIRSMIRIANAYGVRVMLPTFPVNATDFPNFPKSASAEYLYGYAEHNQIIRQLATQESASLYDFERAFPRRKELFLDGHHVSKEGAALQAKMFADHLAKHIL